MHRLRADAAGRRHRAGDGHRRPDRRDAAAAAGSAAAARARRRAAADRTRPPDRTRRRQRLRQRAARLAHRQHPSGRARTAIDELTAAFADADRAQRARTARTSARATCSARDQPRPADRHRQLARRRRHLREQAEQGARSAPGTARRAAATRADVQRTDGAGRTAATCRASSTRACSPRPRRCRQGVAPRRHASTARFAGQRQGQRRADAAPGQPRASTRASPRANGRTPALCRERASLLRVLDPRDWQTPGFQPGRERPGGLHLARATPRPTRSGTARRPAAATACRAPTKPRSLRSDIGGRALSLWLRDCGSNCQQRQVAGASWRSRQASARCWPHAATTTSASAWCASADAVGAAGWRTTALAAAGATYNPRHAEPSAAPPRPAQAQPAEALPHRPADPVADLADLGRGQVRVRAAVGHQPAADHADCCRTSRRPTRRRWAGWSSRGCRPRSRCWRRWR